MNFGSGGLVATIAGWGIWIAHPTNPPSESAAMPGVLLFARIDLGVHPRPPPASIDLDPEASGA